MKVFAFKYSNLLIGKFEIDQFDSLAAGIEQFAQTKQLGPYDYLECCGRTWTLVPGTSGLELREGKVQRPPQNSSGAADTSASTGGFVNVPSALVNRYREGYRIAAAAVSFGAAIKGIGWIIGFFIVVGSIIVASRTSGDAASLCLIYGLMVATFQIVALMFFGVLVSAIGQILRSTLDTAVHTSPFLDEQQKSVVMNISQSKS